MVPRRAREPIWWDPDYRPLRTGLILGVAIAVSMVLLAIVLGANPLRIVLGAVLCGAVGGTVFVARERIRHRFDRDADDD